LTPLFLVVDAIVKRELEKTIMAETKEEKTQKEPGPGEPGYYSPPTVSPVTSPQNPQPGPSTAAGTGSAPPAEAAPEQVDYNDMTVAELKDLAHKRGVEIHSDMLKDDIIKALKKAG
jgi:hypothetical protein